MGEAVSDKMDTDAYWQKLARLFECQASNPYTAEFHAVARAEEMGTDIEVTDEDRTPYLLDDKKARTT